MFVKPFAYERAGSVAEACDLLRAHGGEARLLAGGQSLLPMINSGLVDCEALVDLSHLEGLRSLSEDEGFVEIGALTTHAALEASTLLSRLQPLVSDAAGQVGNPRVRNRGTLGGSLAHADPAAELPLVMTALGATVLVSDGRTSREVAAHELQQSYFSTVLEPDEVVTGVRVPVIGPGWGWSFVEASRRRGDFAMAAAAVLLRTAGGEVIESRVAVGGVAERPLRLGAVEVALTGAGRQELAGRVATLGGIHPSKDASASAEYRRHLVGVIVRRAVIEAYERAEAR